MVVPGIQLSLVEYKLPLKIEKEIQRLKLRLKDYSRLNEWLSMSIDFYYSSYYLEKWVFKSENRF